MKKLFSLHLLFALLCAYSHASPDSVKKNTLYVELIGSGGIFSLNYDRILLHKNKHKLTARAGISYLSQSFLFPIGINYLYGKKHHIEAGFGTTGYYGWKLVIGPTAHLGYRFQKSDGGFMFRAGIAPIMITDGDLKGAVLPIPSIGIGYTFKAKK